MNKMWSSSLSLPLSHSKRTSKKCTSLQDYGNRRHTKNPLSHKEQALSRSSALHYIRLLSRNTDTGTLTLTLNFYTSESPGLQICGGGVTGEPTDRKKMHLKTKCPENREEFAAYFALHNVWQGANNTGPGNLLHAAGKRVPWSKQCRLQPSALCTSSASLLW